MQIKPQWDTTSLQLLLLENKQKPKKTRVGGDVEKLLRLCIDGGNVKWCSDYGKKYGGSLKKLNIELP